jgi:hypothetical protein
MLNSERRRPLESFSKEVLIAWITVRGFSYFDEEIEGIEKRLITAKGQECDSRT